MMTRTALSRLAIPALMAGLIAGISGAAQAEPPHQRATAERVGSPAAFTTAPGVGAGSQAVAGSPPGPAGFKATYVPPGFKAAYLIPAYIYPDGSNWQAWCTILSSYHSTMIANPNSGPGTAVSPAYKAAVDFCQQLQVSVVGYVATSYGMRSMAAVKADIDRYYAWYGVHGIFLDEMSNNAATKAYYRAVYSYVKTKSSFHSVVGNPGIAATTAWQVTAPVVADVIVTFEGAPQGYANWTPPSWMTQAGSPPRSTFANLIYASAGGVATEAICNQSKQKKGGWMDVTTDFLPNPWDRWPDGYNLTRYC